MGKPKKKNAALYMDEPESDENLQYIVGYTEGGAAYGTTWEQSKLIEEREKLEISLKAEGIKNGENPVDLIELTEAFDLQSDYHLFYVNRISGKILSVMEPEEMGEDDESEFDRSVLDTIEYIPLPSRWELNKYEILKEFVFSLESNKMQKDLTQAIKGKGAFRRFYTAIHAYKIQDQWYEFQKERLREIAVKWCDDNHLAYK